MEVNRRWICCGSGFQNKSPERNAARTKGQECFMKRNRHIRAKLVVLLATTTVIVTGLSVFQGRRTAIGNAILKNRIMGFPCGDARDEVVAFLLLPPGSNRFVAGTPIYLMHGLCYRVENQDRGVRRLRRLRVFRPREAADPNNLSWFTVTGPDGKQLAYSGPSVSPTGVEVDVKSTSELFPNGGMVGVITNWDLGAFYRIQEPGVYRVQWHYEMPAEVSGRTIGDATLWSGKVSSNEVEFEIIGK